MKQDITNRSSIETLVNSFYQKVRQDEVIGYIFNDIAQVDWESHLPTMYRFWASVLLGEASFKGNPMRKHILLNAQERLTEVHFDRWLTLWETTVDEHFYGSMATEAKQRAQSIKEMIT